jgi:hypothetical protein
MPAVQAVGKSQLKLTERTELSDPIVLDQILAANTWLGGTVADH